MATRAVGRQNLSAPPAGPVSGAQTIRGHTRRNLILKVAAELFAEYGYDTVAINDIGQAAGITGPGIYRYFPSKEELLAAIYDHLLQRHRDGVVALLQEDRSPAQLLEGLIDLQIELAIEEPEKIRIVDREVRHLPPEFADWYHKDARQRLKVWADVVAAVRPDFSSEETAVAVHSVLALINSIALRRTPERAGSRIGRRLKAMAVGAIMNREENLT